MEPIINCLDWKIGGVAGDGILNAGMMFAKVFLRGGLYVFATAEYPSLIRGGHNHLDVRIEDRPVFAHSSHPSLLVALNQETVERHWKKLKDNAGIVYDDENVKLEGIGGLAAKPFTPFMVPLARLARDCGGILYKNTVALGASLALVDYDLDLLLEVLEHNFGRKGDETVEANKKAATLGYRWIREHYGPDTFPCRLRQGAPNARLMMTGNEALALGALRAGCGFLSAYPMTPASSILSNMAGFSTKYNVVVKQTEDEIAAINMAIGASYAGVRSMVCTSGGGFALMQEGFGLAGMSETPIVVAEVSRPGPATGMATHSAQGDLRYLIHASPDEHPRILMAPGDAEECYHLAMQAFNLAETYHLPVILLSDKYLGESYKTIDGFQDIHPPRRGGFISTDELARLPAYLRYQDTPSGVSPRTIPGQPKGMHVATSYEHDEAGHEREEETWRVMMVRKRWRKLEAARNELPPPALAGPEEADLTIVSWGSTKGAILEAMERLAAHGITCNFLQIRYIQPLHDDAITRVMRRAKSTLIIEGNQTAQLAGWIKQHNGLSFDHALLKYDGRPFSPSDIVDGILKIYGQAPPSPTLQPPDPPTGLKTAPVPKAPSIPPIPAPPALSAALYPPGPARPRARTPPPTTSATSSPPGAPSAGTTISSRLSKKPSPPSPRSPRTSSSSAASAAAASCPTTSRPTALRASTGARCRWLRA